MTVCLPIRFAERPALSPDEKRAVEALIAECRAADGLDPCLKFDTHLNADRDLPPWILAWAEPAHPRSAAEGDAGPAAGILAGAACAFAPTRGEGEISACVLPVFRRQGIFKALYGGLAEALGRSGAESVMLVCEGASTEGAVVAGRLGASLDRAEYLMGLPPERLALATPRPSLRLLPVAPDGLDAFAALSAAVFGESAEDARTFAEAALADPSRELFVARDAEGPVGIAALAEEGGGYRLHGLGVVPPRRGKGLGGAVLDACLVVLKNRGARRVSLEVDVDNQAALALYRSRGFARERRMDYWRLSRADGQG